ncbi:hypothetical protein GCM10007276_00780 [Agaricicola taiwanensis]|uniref:Uncharacterized protein n=1 Tax=Agaricicola taiwanensis TaxID=591372 RepID=A0A8J2YF03_9RHOB|nr:hypothetical protein [Agaricicola taiwanensis]GGE27438.1 hypothetical protein GCM10007276_00780 [Agaricicola taiwanensis]
MSHIIIRLLLITSGYVLAVMAATAVLMAITLSYGTPQDPVDQGAFLVMLVAFAPTLWWIVGPITTVGFAAAAGIAEVFAIRSWIFFALAGAAIAYTAWSLLEIGESGPVFTALEAVAAGFVAGLTYWLVAGRTSGVSSRASETA